MAFLRKNFATTSGLPATDSHGLATVEGMEGNAGQGFGVSAEPKAVKVTCGIEFEGESELVASRSLECQCCLCHLAFVPASTALRATGLSQKNPQQNTSIC